MRQASQFMTDSLAREATTLCRLFRITRKDGAVLTYTDAVEAVILGGVVYRPDTGFDCSALALAATRSGQQSATIIVRLSDDGFTEYDLRARLYQAAVLEVMVVNRRRPSGGVVSLFKGVFGRIRIVESSFAHINVGSQTANANPTIAYEFYSPSCVVSLGDSRCGIDIESLLVNFTLTAVSADGYSVTATFTGADNYWAFGFIKWTAGANKGLITPVRTSTSTVVQLSYRPTKMPLIGDVGRIYPGCDKIITTCRDKFNNVVNFRGQPWIPTQQDLNFNRTAVAAVTPQPGNFLFR